MVVAAADDIDTAAADIDDDGVGALPFTTITRKAYKSHTRLSISLMFLQPPKG